MRGQMFIIAAVFIVMGLLLIHGMLNVFELFEESTAVASLTGDIALRNIAKEYEYTAGIASRNQANVSAISMLSNLSLLLAEDGNAKMFYSAAFVNGTTSNYSVTAGNYLGGRVNATISATGSAPSSYSVEIADRSNSTVFFSSSPGIKTITITYSISNETITERFPLNVTGKNTLQIFYDIELDKNNINVRTKGIYNTTW